MSSKKSYKIMAGPPAPAEEEYISKCEREWQKLIDGVPAEKALQYFLEKNPSLVPGFLTPVGSGHYPLYGALISQPILPSLRSRQPDFMWLAIDSLACYPTLIEIEEPSKKVFTGSRIPSAEFNQARISSHNGGHGSLNRVIERN